MSKQSSEAEEPVDVGTDQTLPESPWRRPPSGAMNFSWLVNPFNEDVKQGEQALTLEGATVGESTDEQLHAMMTEALGVWTVAKDDHEEDPDAVVEDDLDDSDSNAGIQLEKSVVHAEFETEKKDDIKTDESSVEHVEIPKVKFIDLDNVDDEVYDNESEKDRLMFEETDDGEVKMCGNEEKESIVLQEYQDNPQPKKSVVKKEYLDRKRLLDHEEAIDEVSDVLIEDSEVTLPSGECGISESNDSDALDMDDDSDPKCNVENVNKETAGESVVTSNDLDDFEAVHQNTSDVSGHLDISVDIKNPEKAGSVKDMVEVHDTSDDPVDCDVKFSFSGDEETRTDHTPFSKYLDMLELSHQAFPQPVNTPTQENVTEEMLKKTMKWGKPDQLKMMIRHAHWSLDHEIRRNLWVLQCQHQHRAVKHDIFSEFATDLFPKGEYTDVRLPSFVDLSLTNTYYLTDEGILNVKKVLSVLEHSSPEIVFSPLLYSYVALFLHFMEPSDCYNCIDALLHETVAGYIAQTKVSYEASKLVIRDLAKKYAKSGYVLLVRNSGSIDTVFDSWTSWLFQDLPFPYLLRVIDCYLHEGVKVMYRVALAILILFAKHQPKKTRLSLRDNSNGSPLLNSLRQFCREPPMSIEKLLKVGFGVRGLTRKEINKLQVKNEMYINSTKHLHHSDQNGGGVSGKMQLSRSFSGPIVLQNVGSNMLSPDMLFAIWTWLPQRYAVCQPELLYTSEEHGTSLVTLYQRVENYQPTVIVIKSTNDEIFGAFCSAFWRERREAGTTMLSYFGTGETFIFALQPERKKYEWVGLSGEQIPNTAHMFQAGDRNCLIIGGGHGEAIYLDENLLHCRTEKCDTFNNEPLSAHEDFICKVVEVYGFQ